MKRNALLSIIFLSSIAIPASAKAPPFETGAQVAFMLDLSSGAVLFAKDADRRIPPASMAKLRTAEYVFHELKEGRLSENDSFEISENAWRRGGAPSGGSADRSPAP